MWFIRTFFKSVQTESHGEIPGEELMRENGDSGDMPDSGAKTDENSGDQTDSHAEVHDEVLLDQIGDSGDAPNFAAEGDEISAGVEVLTFKTVLTKMVEGLWLMDPDFMQEIITLTLTAFLGPVTLFFVFRALSQLESAVILMDVVYVNGTSLLLTDCNATCQQETFFGIINAYSLDGPYRTVCNFESPYQTTGRPAIATGMTCKRRERARKSSRYCMPVTGKSIRGMCKCGYETREFQPNEAWCDSRAAQMTLSYGFHCNDGVHPCGYNTTGFQSAETRRNLCDTCAELITVTFFYDYYDGLFKYGHNITEFQSTEPMNHLCGSRGTRYIQPLVIERDGEVFFVRVEVLLSEAGDAVSMRLSSAVSVDSSGSTKKKASEKCDGEVPLWPRFHS